MWLTCSRRRGSASDEPEEDARRLVHPREEGVHEGGVMSSSEFLALATLLMAAQAVDGIEEFNRRLKGEPEPRHPRAGYYIG